MPKKIPQFFQDPPKRKSTTTNFALYSISGTSAEQEPISVLVECSEGGGNVPRNASAFQGLKIDFEKEMQTIGRVAESVIGTFRRLSPGEVEIEFGIELGGAAGIPMITKSEAKANFKITLKWTEKPDPVVLTPSGTQ